MAIFASTTLGSSDPSRAMSIKALEARAQALAQANAKQEVPTSMPSPWQGAGYLANTLADTVAAKRADSQAAAQNQALARVMANIGPEGPNPGQLAQINIASPDLAKLYAQQAFQSRQGAETIQAQKDLAAQKAEQDKAFLAEQERLRQERPTEDPIATINRAAKRGEISPEEATAEKNKAMAGSPAEQKLQGEEQTKNIELQSLIGSLKQAQGLGTAGIYEGPRAGIKSFIGEHIATAGGPLGGVMGMDKDTTERTQRFNMLMSGPILQTLNSLKGSSSDKELNYAIDTLNKPDATLKNKMDAIDTILRKSDALQRASDLRLQQLGAKKVEVAPAAAPAGGGDANAAAKAWLDANPNDPRAAAVRAKLGIK